MKIIVGSKFQLQQTILIFGTNFKKKKKGIRPVEKRKSENHH